MSKMPARRYVPVVPAADYFGVHPNTIRNWINKGLIKAHRSPGGRLWLVDLNELDAAITHEVSA